MRKLRLMPEYYASGLWWIDDPDGRYEVAVDELPLTDATRARLARWIQTYTEQLDWDDPGHSPPPSSAWKQAFERERLFLWHQIQNELGADYLVFVGDKTIDDHPSTFIKQRSKHQQRR